MTKGESPTLRSPQRHPYRVRGNDCYETPPQATWALLKAEPELP
jgi:hypothetical protein